MPVECTYKDCDLSFATEKLMKRHKKSSDEHDYCDVCDEDFKDYENLVQHKILRPEEHGRACRVCGDEFGSDSGLRRHIEQSHKIAQQLVCIGCKQKFHRATFFIEHLEFGQCKVISKNQFLGHVVHKHLIHELLKMGPAHERFMQKISKFDAAQDFEEEGGVSLDDPLDADIQDVQFEALKPGPCPIKPIAQKPVEIAYPPLPSRSGAPSSSKSDVTSELGKMSLGDTASPSTNGHSKVWGSSSGKSASKTLFPNAKPTPVSSEYSVAAYDKSMEEQQGVNMMRTRFWDPESSDWNPDKFYDSAMDKYACPFNCEQMFAIVADLNKHICKDHRNPRMTCPTCVRNFKTATALMAHCEPRNGRCAINEKHDYGMLVDRLSGGFLAVNDTIRPDHRNNPATMVRNPYTLRMEPYAPLTAWYLEYTVTTPPDWKEPVKAAARIGGIPGQNTSNPWQ